jgi:hypothetical protein
MPELKGRLQTDIDYFRERVLTDPVGVLDPEGVVHHEFVSGNHGRKLDFDKIKNGTDFYIDWVAIYARAVLSIYPQRRPDAFVGIANGANRLSKSVGNLLGIAGLTTEKVDAKTVKLDEAALDSVEENDFSFILTIEDVGTTGGTTATAVNDLRRVGIPRIESVNFWQRNPSLPRLDDLRIPYSAVILNPLPMFSPAVCDSNPDGYCANQVTLIPHEK